MDRDQLLDLIDNTQLPRSELYECPYLPNRQARQTGFAIESLDGETYHELMDRGFRRNGTVFYAMACPNCARCVPLRVPVQEFRPSRSQRRTLAKNRDVRVEFRAPRYTAESHQLYLRYLQHQHPNSPADESSEQFRASFYDQVVPSVEARYLLGDQILGISLLDSCSRSLSAVYHFFDPEHRDRRIGVLSALLEIEHARELGIPYYYLGYWVHEAPTMQYKLDYRPNERLIDGVWKCDNQIT